jgi:RNA polymerase sigma factor (sigma-70 family)
VSRSYESLGDTELVQLARSGEDAAFAELWRRHSDAGRRYAGSITRNVDSEDIVSEAFAKIFSLIKRGKGPTNGFRSYLAAAIRHTSEGFGRTRRETPIDFLDDLADDRTNDEHELRTLDQSLTIVAFKSLPERWQEALWYSEVEQLSTKESAALFGIKPTAMAMLTFRAREGLREAWIQAHIAKIPEESEHRWVIERLGAYARHKLPAAQQEMVEAHLAQCASCSIVAEEARFVGSRLALGLLAPIIGAGAAAAYLASGSHVAVAAELTSDDQIQHGPPRRRARRRPSSRSVQLLVGASAIIAVAAVYVGVALLPTAHVSDGTHVSDGKRSGGQDDTLTHPATALPSRPTASSPPPSPQVDPTLTVAADTGELQLFYPILSGHASPGAIVQVVQGGADIARLRTPGDGDWSTGQLILKGTSALRVTSTLGSTVESRRIDFRVRQPLVFARAVAAGVKVTITGARNAPFLLTAGDGAVAASKLDATGAWSATYPAGVFDAITLVVRYQAGDRFGPSHLVQR